MKNIVLSFGAFVELRKISEKLVWFPIEAGELIFRACHGFTNAHFSSFSEVFLSTTAPLPTPVLYSSLEFQSRLVKLLWAQSKSSLFRQKAEPSRVVYEEQNESVVSRGLGRVFSQRPPRSRLSSAIHTSGRGPGMGAQVSYYRNETPRSK